MRPFRRLRAALRGDPAASAGRYIDSLDCGLVPYLADSHGPDGGTETYDSVVRDHGFDPLVERVAS